MKKMLIVLSALMLTGGLALAQEPTIYNPVGLNWDANTESDLAGYYVYEAQVADGQVIGEYMVSVPAPLTDFTFTPGSHADGQYYWKLTAYDLAGNESGFSLEVTAEYNVTPPSPPAGCSVVY